MHKGSLKFRCAILCLFIFILQRSILHWGCWSRRCILVSGFGIFHVTVSCGSVVKKSKKRQAIFRLWIYSTWWTWHPAGDFWDFNLSRLNPFSVESHPKCLSDDSVSFMSEFHEVWCPDGIGWVSGCGHFHIDDRKSFPKEGCGLSSVKWNSKEDPFTRTDYCRCCCRCCWMLLYL